MLRSRDLILPMLVAPIWMELLRYFGTYESQRLRGPGQIVRQIISANFFGALILVPPAYLLNGWLGFNRVVLSVLVCTVVLTVLKLAIRILLLLLRRRGIDRRYVCFVGSWDAAKRAEAEFALHPEWGLHLSLVGVGDVGSRQYHHPDGRSVSSADLRQVLVETAVDEVWIAAPLESMWAERTFLSICNDYGLLPRVIVASQENSNSGDRDVALADVPGPLNLGVAGRKQDLVGMICKRATDLVLGTILIICAVPILFAAAVLVKLSSPGPLIFTQTRVGLRGRRFRIYKFRTMIDGAEAHVQGMAHRSITGGPVFKDPADWRITPIGRILRKFSIDELPQLVNVLVGQMSLVGPRPLPVSEAQAIDGAYFKRFSMKPGLTCLWQVNGRSGTDYARWMSYDLQYVDNWSLWLDMRLIAKTVPVVFSGRGAC